MSENDIIPNTPETPEDVDKDIAASNLVVGPELEMPLLHNPDSSPKDENVWMVSPGYKSGAIRDDLRSKGIHGGRVTIDRSAGTEMAPSPPATLVDAPNWLREAIATVEEMDSTLVYQPCGIRWRDGPNGGNFRGNSGMHIHVSPLPYDAAQMIHDFSLTPKGRLFVGTAVAMSHRGDVYAGISRDYNGGNPASNLTDPNNPGDAVMRHRDRDRHDRHFEWRKPGPMTPEHFHIVCMFLRIAEQDADAAREWATTLVDRGDTRLTAFGRFEAIRDYMDSRKGKDTIEKVRRVPTDPEDITAYNTVDLDKKPSSKVKDKFTQKGDGADTMLEITEVA